LLYDETKTFLFPQILNNVLKAKKPVVIVATKCDEANEIGVREIERLVNRKEFKTLNIPVIETSAHEGVNVDAAFFTLAQQIDRTRGRSRVLTFYEAAHVRRELLDLVPNF
jgi:Rho GTPase-activating protein 5